MPRATRLSPRFRTKASRPPYTTTERWRATTVPPKPPSGRLTPPRGTSWPRTRCRCGRSALWPSPGRPFRSSNPDVPIILRNEPFGENSKDFLVAKTRFATQKSSSRSSAVPDELTQVLLQSYDQRLKSCHPFSAVNQQAASTPFTRGGCPRPSVRRQNGSAGIQHRRNTLGVGACTRQVATSA